MGRYDERRPCSSRTLYWEVFFSLEGAELAEFVGFFGSGAGAAGLVSTFLGWALGLAGGGAAAGGVALADDGLFLVLVLGGLASVFGDLVAIFDDLALFLAGLVVPVSVVGFCFAPLVLRRMGLKADER